MYLKLKPCIQDDDFKVFRSLLQNCSSQTVNERDEFGRTLLHFAVELGRGSFVSELLASGWNPNIEDNDSWTPLLGASRDGHTSICESLLEFVAAVNHTDLGAWTPLNWACYKNRVSTVQLLIQFGADVECSGHHNAAPLIWAAGRGYTEVAKALLENGAKVNRPDKHGNTPLIWAARKGNLALVELLLKKGATVDVVGMKSWTALLVAVEGNHIDVVRRLLEKRPNLFVMDVDGYTPLSIACREGFVDICQMLLDAGATVNGSDRYGDTVLIYAAKNGHRSIVEKLIKKYADVNAQGKNGDTALHWAIMKNHISIVRILLATNPNLETVSDDGNTPLLSAAKVANAEAAQLLLEKRAKVSAVDKAGDTALHIAMRKHNKAIAEMILKDMKNSKLLYKPNKAGMTPYNIDNSKEKPILVQISGNRRLFSSKDSENSLGYGLYSNTLSDILIDPMTSLPLTVGLFAKWGSGKSFLINKLKEELQYFGHDSIDKTCTVNFSFGMFLLNMVVIIGLVVGIALHDWVPGVVTFAVLFVVSFSCVFAFRCHSNRNHSYYSPSRLDFLYSWLNSLVLLTKVTFCIPPDPNATDSKDAKPLQFVFGDQARVSTGNSGVSILIIITSLFEQVESKYGEVATRMCRVFRSKTGQRYATWKFRRACCVPSVVVFIVLVDIILVGVGLMANFLVDLADPGSKESEDITAVKAAMITCAIIFAISLIASANGIYRALLALAVSPRSRLKKKIAQFANLGSDGQQQLHVLKEEVKELVETVRTLDAFCGRTTRMTVALDGLDTYKQEQVVAILDGVSQLFSEPNSPFVVLLAIDPHLVSKAVESNVSCVLNESPMTGYNYLRNIVQLPFYLQNAGLRKIKTSQQAAITARGGMDDGFGPTAAKHSVKKSSGESSAPLTSMRRNRSSAANLNRKVHHTDSVNDAFGRNRHLSDSMESGIAMMGHQADVTKVLLTDGYFSDVDPKSLRRLMNVVSVSGRLMKAFHIDFNWLHLSSWINLTEQWPYRISWIIAYVEERENKLDDFLSLRCLYERVKDLIPVMKASSDPLADIDKDPKKLEALISSSRNALQLVHLKIFVPFTNNLDPFLGKYIRENCKEILAAAAPALTDFESIRLSDADRRNTDLPSVPQCTCLAPIGTPCIHPPIPDILLRQPLAQMSTETLCEGFKLIEGLRAGSVQGVADVLKLNNICGRVLLLCSLADLKPVLRMSFGDWELFQSLVLALRNREKSFPTRTTEPVMPVHRLATRTDSGTYDKQINLEEQLIHGALQVLNEEAMEDVFDKVTEDEDRASLHGSDAPATDETDVLFLQTNPIVSTPAAMVDFRSSNLSLVTSNPARSRTVTEVVGWQDAAHSSLSRAASQRSVVDSGATGPASILRKNKGLMSEASSPKRPMSQEMVPLRLGDEETDSAYANCEERQPLVATFARPTASEFMHERRKSLKGEKTRRTDH